VAAGRRASTFLVDNADRLSVPGCILARFSVPMAHTFPTPSGGVASVRRRPGFVAFCVLMVAMSILVSTRVAHSEGREHLYHRHHAAHASDHELLSSPPAVDQPDDQTVRDRLQRFAAGGEPVFCGGAGEPVVALTFDDGPGPYTQETLDLLRSRGMTATFFFVGKLLADPRFQEIPAAAARLGAVGDHTWNHVSMVGLSPNELEQEIGRTRHALARATGHPISLFRPPLEQHDDTVDGWLRDHAMTEVLWSIDTQDSMGARANHIYAEVRDHLSPGDIVLMHENRGTTQNALPRILNLIEARGYRTVTVPQLLAIDPPSRTQLRAHTCS
jgi:peptidoglycan-N-acetylglucosamine deacetylase